MGARELWGRLTVDGIETSGFVRLRFSDLNCPVYAARRIDSGLEALILEVDKESIPPGAAYPQTRGFAVSAEAIDSGRGGRTRLMLSLVEDRYRDVFVSLVEDVVDHLANARSPEKAVGEMFSRLARWQTFLKQHDPEGLSATEQRGLFGELMILRHLTNIGLAPGAAVHAWRGPRASSHDFQLGGGSIEVKATSAVTPTRFKINNVKQLDDSSVPALILALVVLDETESSGHSLPALIDEIEGGLPEVIWAEWEESLTAAGYLKVQRERYEHPHYVFRDQRLFHVTEGFPRLLEADLPQGVSEVSYSVAIAAIQQFRCTDEDMAALIQESTHE